MNVFKTGMFLSLFSAPWAFADDQIAAIFDGPVFGSVIESQPVDFQSSVALQALMSSGSLTSVELVTHLLRRIDALNNKGPQLNAVIEINPDALGIAEQLDQERAANVKRGPLHGIPVLVKDNFDTADKMQTTAGSPALVGPAPQHDAFVVNKLREAGAIILGKANLSEWSAFRGDNIPNGWSGRGGQTRNPHDLASEVCGSSSGSAVGVAAGFAPVSIGTETHGSIICPASKNGVVGVRPTTGLLSRAGVIPISSRQDTPGPMARTVTDAALMLTAMSGKDARDKATYGVPNNPVDYFSYLRADALQGKRLGYPVKTVEGQFMDDDPAFETIKKHLRRIGAILVPIDVPASNRYTEWELLQTDFAAELNTYLQTRPGLDVRSMNDIVAFNTRHPGAENYDQNNLINSSSMDIEQQLYFEAATQLQRTHRELIDGLMGKYGLDALIDWSDRSFNGSGALAGYPGLTLPVGANEKGMPLGLYWLSTAWDEARLLSFAYALEQGLPAGRQDL
ncbi:amidase family protein [Pseudomonas abietaniphila]|uniref:Amidase n=1 Tax=Pseudomonas abietaniphila TaxID=89065 RepID=A0A1G7WYA3_9PSED|nr:amidase family protein [Pseudomonas abietaniphila]SDG76300.1 amidase [Pseudomonas abietaniphila]